MGVMVAAEDQVAELKRGAAEIISEAELTERIKSKKVLKIKLGLDPTAPHIHLGFAVVLRKLRKFQDFGHEVQLLIGDFTARVGDPTGRSETRKVLTPEEIEANGRTYRDQLSLILDPERTKVHFNSKWLGPMTFADVVGLASKYTVARILERDDFANRYRDGIPIHMHELIYPLMQGWDSVNLESDVEMGGTDQKFNNLVGRSLQREVGQTPQVVFLMPILEGLDGVQKMSKSLGNYVGITEPPTEMFGKLMSLPDHLMDRYFELCTDVDMASVRVEMHPRDKKRWLGREIVTIYHGSEAGKAADDAFMRQFSQREVPTEMDEKTVASPASIVDLIVELGFAGSKRDARRLVDQGAVQLDGEKVAPGEVSFEDGAVLKVSRRFVRLRLG